MRLMRIASKTFGTMLKRWEWVLFWRAKFWKIARQQWLGQNLNRKWGSIISPIERWCVCYLRWNDKQRRIWSLDRGVTCGCGGWFGISLCTFISKNGYGGEAVESMASWSPFWSLFGSSFLNSVTVEVDFGAAGCFLCFLDTLGLSLTVNLIPKIPLLFPSLVETCFESAIPKKLQVPSFSHRGNSIKKPGNVVEVSKVDKCFKIDGGRWWSGHLESRRYDFGWLSWTGRGFELVRSLTSAFSGWGCGHGDRYWKRMGMVLEWVPWF